MFELSCFFNLGKDNRDAELIKIKKKKLIKQK